MKLKGFTLIPLLCLMGCQNSPKEVSLHFEYCNLVQKENHSYFEKNDDKYGALFTFEENHTLTKDEVDEISKKVSLLYPQDNSKSGYHMVVGYSLSLDEVKNDFVEGLQLIKDLHFYYYAC